MHNLGTKILATFYLCAGGFIGEPIRRIYQDRGSELFGMHWYLWTVLGVNVVAIGFLIFLGRRAVVEPPLRKIEHPSSIFAHGLPMTRRVTFLLCATCYTIGFVVGLLLA